MFDRSYVEVRFPKVLLTALLLGCLYILLPLNAAIAFPERVSVASDGTQGNYYSEHSSISANGRFVAFSSRASNLVAGGTNNLADVFLHDRQTGKTSLVSVASAGATRNKFDAARDPSISANGHVIVFTCNNLGADDTDLNDDIYLHDRRTSETTRITSAFDGLQARFWASLYPSISADGRFVTFAIDLSPLIPGPGERDVYVYDHQTGETSLVSATSDGTPGNWDSNTPSISADGRFIAFISLATNLVPEDPNNKVTDILVKNRLTDEITRVSVASDGTPGNDLSSGPSMSKSGRFVAFLSYASNLVAGDTNNDRDVFVHDRQTGETSRVSVASDGTQGNGKSELPSISADGRFVAFASAASNLVEGDTNNYADVFVHDRQTEETTRVNVTPYGTQANGKSGGWFRGMPSMSADGRFVAFPSDASNLVAGDTNGYRDIFMVRNPLSNMQLFAENFTDGNMTGDPDWNEISGAWKVLGGSNKVFVSHPGKNNRAVVQDASVTAFLSGQIETHLKFSNRFMRTPNGLIIFAYQDLQNYRYVGLAGGQDGKILIGQRGNFASETQGIKANKRINLNVSREGHRVWANVYPDGKVDVYLADELDRPQLQLSYYFPYAYAGQVGYQAIKAATLFDNFFVWDELALQDPP